ncbi:hypothetical protein ACFYOK_10835 [Microbispora bryophytorum]|uniref:hypothetical protein n=1 Tax=Microbispora bryophytorum TaxID=1460882 RepID=UPI0033C4B53A
MPGIVTTSGHAGHGPHAAEPRPGAEVLAWQPDTGRNPRSRTLQWTCECRSPRYFLCSAGGLLYVGRNDGGKWRETDRLSYREGEALWARILRGEVR